MSAQPADTGDEENDFSAFRTPGGVDGFVEDKRWATSVYTDEKRDLNSPLIRPNEGETIGECCDALFALYWLLSAVCHTQLSWTYGSPTSS